MTMTNRFEMPSLNCLPEDIRTKLLSVQEKAGFVPNVFLMLARRPDEFRAFVIYHDAIMLKEPSHANGLTKADREMIVVATSSANSCLYCVVSHGAILRIYERNPLIADQVATNYKKAGITLRQRVMLDFAMKVSLDSANLDDADYAALHGVGFNDEDAWDIGAVAAFFALSNRMANVSGMMPNPEFYLMGRVPKTK